MKVKRGKGVFLVRMIEVKDIFVYLKDFEFYYVFIVIDREISVCIIDLGKDLVKEGYYYYR